MGPVCKVAVVGGEVGGEGAGNRGSVVNIKKCKS